MNNEENKITEDKIRKLLLSIGVPVTVKGYRYLVQALLISTKDPTKQIKVCKEIYPQLAIKYNLSIRSIETAMREAIYKSVSAMSEDVFKHIFRAPKSVLCRGVCNSKKTLTPATYILGITEYLFIENNISIS